MIRLGSCFCLPLLLTSRLLFFAPQSLASKISGPSSSYAFSVASTLKKAEMKAPPPPAAKKVNHVMELFGDVRIDDYYWLRDDSRKNNDVLSYLQEENEYVDNVMSGMIEFLHRV